MRRTASALISALAGLMVFASTSVAQEESATGLAAYTPVSSSATDLGDGTTAVRQTSEGYVFTDDPSSSFNLVTQDCTSTDLMAANGALVRSSGYCAGLDRDADMYWISYWNGPDGGEWHLLGGTGKFEGISGGGTSETLAAHADGSFSIRWEGTWTTP